MSDYVNLLVSRNMYFEIINALKGYCTELINYNEVDEIVHIIDYLEDEYQEDIAKQNQEFRQWMDYEDLFYEYMEDLGFKDADGYLNNKGIRAFTNFDKVNKVIENYKEKGSLDILDVKEQFFLILDIMNVLEDLEYKKGVDKK